SGSAGRIRKGLFGLFSSPENGEGGSTGSKDTPFADWQPGDTCYEWLASGMLAGVKTPDGKTVYFGYDALGRRVSKTVDGTVRRFGWDGNVVLHEWEISEADKPRLITDGSGREEYDDTENPENLVTWIYDGTSFTPVAKVTGRERYTIVHDYLGTPTQAYDSRGNLVWEMLLDVYGEVKECHGDRTLVPFRYQGQYEDIETELYYNRFRYYSPQMGMYISSDPIGLAGNNPTLYGNVQDVNILLDLRGLNPLGLLTSSMSNPWDTNSSITSIVVPKGGIDIEMAMSPHQTKPGGWGTTDHITSVDFVRNRLAVTPEFKPEISHVQRFHIPEGIRIQVGIVGPQIYNGKIYEGGGNQIQILNYEDRAKLKPIGAPRKISCK
ncbi:RHS repeat domain-containing protein, partial [Phocaeicola vulgatus]|uniref:RHS repeat domain-containing protein n=1 Tax=Phocaeicola vulgatus TaxID=821 RepID=UPI00293E8EBE